PSTTLVSRMESVDVCLGDRLGAVRRHVRHAVAASQRSLFLVCWQSLLARLTGQLSIAVLVNLDFRQVQPDLRGSLGPLCQTVPLVSCFTETQSVRDAIRATE